MRRYFERWCKNRWKIAIVWSNGFIKMNILALQKSKREIVWYDSKQRAPNDTLDPEMEERNKWGKLGIDG